jgi:hypothetical protein
VRRNAAGAEEGHVNWLGVVVATIAAMVIGSIWYSNMGFGRTWVALSGRQIAEGQTQVGPLYALTALSALVESIALAWFINQTGWTTGAGGALIGLYAGLGFIATAMFAQVLFAGQAPRLFAINAGYQTFQLVVMGAIIGFLGGGAL